MKRLQGFGVAVAVVIFGAFVLAGCGGASATAPPSPPAQPAATAQPSAPSAASASAAPRAAIETPIAPENNPPGDIPDNQAFVSFASSAGGYKLEVPEGWARTANGANATFTDNKYNGVAVDVTNAAPAPTVASVRASVIPMLEQSGRAVQVQKVEQVSLPAGAVVRVTYAANSDPNTVTGKQIRLENERYIFFKNGNEATLTLSAPQGADNVDQWQRMAKSFTWTA
ncbi:MAG: hypothetical protein M3081_15220 [Gemmatimonadota bacterium]|nr:hypothetical protein [Gemmatimonadota bacterium]